MQNWIKLIACMGVFVSQAHATDLTEPSQAFLLQLQGTLVKVATATHAGLRGFGTGVAISKEDVVTNCHVLADATGISVTKWGVEYPPVSLQADWKHDLCILNFQWAEFSAASLGDSASVHYEEPVISISMPGDSLTPYVELSKVKALYPFDDSKVMRTQAAFAVGASGSPVFDYAGKLIGISTFKSPGRKAYYYNMPIKWVKALLKTPTIDLQAKHALPFWDAPEKARPFFMQIVLPYQNERWQDVQGIAKQWTAQEPSNAEAWYYLGEAARQLGEADQAKQAFDQALRLHPEHPASLASMALMANAAGDANEVARIRLTLQALSTDLAEDLDASLQAAH